MGDLCITVWQYFFFNAHLNAAIARAIVMSSGQKAVVFNVGCTLAKRMVTVLENLWKILKEA